MQLATRVANGRQLTPILLIHSKKFIDIASSWRHDIYTALSECGSFFVWGDCGEKTIRMPEQTDFKSFHEIFASYRQITHQTFNNSVIQAIVKPNPNAMSQLKHDVNKNQLPPKYEQEFKELEKIGEGGFGQVYKALNLFDGQNYAVKKVRLKGQ